MGMTESLSGTIPGTSLWCLSSRFNGSIGLFDQISTAVRTGSSGRYGRDPRSDPGGVYPVSWPWFVRVGPMKEVIGAVHVFAGVSGRPLTMAQTDPEDRGRPRNSR